MGKTTHTSVQDFFTNNFHCPKIKNKRKNLFTILGGFSSLTNIIFNEGQVWKRKASAPEEHQCPHKKVQHSVTGLTVCHGKAKAPKAKKGWTFNRSLNVRQGEQGSGHAACGEDLY